jgi:hypothetical protein
MEADFQLIPPHTCNTIKYSRAEGSGDCEQQTVEKIHGVAITTRGPPCNYHVPPKIARTGGRLLRDLLPPASHAGNMGRSSGRIYRDFNLTMLSEGRQDSIVEVHTHTQAGYPAGQVQPIATSMSLVTNSFFCPAKTGLLFLQIRGPSTRPLEILRPPNADALSIWIIARDGGWLK